MDLTDVQWELIAPYVVARRSRVIRCRAKRSDCPDRREKPLQECGGFSLRAVAKVLDKKCADFFALMRQPGRSGEEPNIPCKRKVPRGKCLSPPNIEQPLVRRCKHFNMLRTGG